MSQGQVNPLGLLIRPGIQEISLDSIHNENLNLNNLMSSKSTSDSMKNSSSGYYQNRVRREQNYVVNAETYTKENGKKSEIVKMVRCNIYRSYNIITMYAAIVCFYNIIYYILFSRTVCWEIQSVSSFVVKLKNCKKMKKQLFL